MVTANLRQVIYALSDALDLVGVDDVAHGKRVGVMAAECAKALRMPQDDISFLLDLGLLHDIGVSKTTTHQHLVEEFDWAGSQVHAGVGYELLKDFAPLARMALPIRYHHTRWDVLMQERVEPSVVRQANLILLVDRVDALAARYYAGGRVLLHLKEIQHEIAQRSGTYFDPLLVKTFLDISSHEAFWLNLGQNALVNYLNDMLARHPSVQATGSELLALAQIFAKIVDAKSPFTTRHSCGVAQVASLLGYRFGLSPERCTELKIAGLLHDLGKLRVPDDILESAGPLNIEQRMVMNTHSFETMQILKKIQGFEEITTWAAEHHEAPGGTGYPFGIDAATLPLEAKILRVADIFQAMSQNRPYRPGLSRQDLTQFMEDFLKKGRIDSEVGHCLLEHMDEMLAAAQQEEIERRSSLTPNEVFC